MTEFAAYLEGLLTSPGDAPIQAAIGLCVAILAAAISPSQRPFANWTILPAIVLSPLTFSALSPEVWFKLAASVLLFGAVAEFARNGERYQHVAPAGLRLMLGAALTPALWAALPAILLISPALSPWRENGNQVRGFLLVLWAPVLMLAAAALYLHLMFDFSVYSPTAFKVFDFTLQMPSALELVTASLPLAVLAAAAAFQREARRPFILGVISALAGLVSIASLGASFLTQHILASGAAYAFAAASTRPGLFMALAVFTSAASVYLES